MFSKLTSNFKFHTLDQNSSMTPVQWSHMFTSNSGTILNKSGPSMVYPCQLTKDSRSVVALVVFSTIFCLSIIGNCMVIVTIVRNRFMRTVTNLFLVNLAVSDLLLTLICMPPTLTGILFKCFLWGPATCKFIAYMQPVSVAACSFTLALIALERYHAICRPLQARHWKTKQHALIMICISWGLSFICTVPSAISADLLELSTGQNNCRATWGSHRAFIVYLSYVTTILLITPLIVMCILYSLVIKTLWHGMKMDKRGASSERHVGKTK